MKKLFLIVLCAVSITVCAELPIKPIAVRFIAPSLLSTKNTNHTDNDATIDQAAQLLITVHTTYKVQVLLQEKSKNKVIAIQQPPYSPKHQRKINVFKKIVTRDAKNQQPTEISQQAEVVESLVITVPAPTPIPAQAPIKRGFYCPYCDVRFTNWTDAVQHSETNEHQSARNAAEYTDPTKYVLNNDHAMNKWRHTSSSRYGHKRS